MGTEKNGHRGGFRAGNGGPPRLAWCFYTILEHFLRVGAKGPWKELHDEQVALKVLEMDVLSPDMAPEMLPLEAFWGYYRLPMLRRKTGIDYIVHLEYMLTSSTSQLAVCCGCLITLQDLVGYCSSELAPSD